MTLLPLLLLLSLAPPDTGFAAVVRTQLARYPASTTTDLYKLAHQASFGVEHAVPDSATAAAWLEREWREMGSGPATPLLDTIVGGGTLARLHLRAWRDRGGTQATVLRAFLAAAVPRDTARFSAHWAEVVALARAGAIPFDADSLVVHADAMRARGLPAVSHSPAYRDAYRPAYRVVRTDLVRSRE